MEVGIIGAGNLAWHLATVFEKNHISVDIIYNRSIKNAEALSQFLYDAPYTDDVNLENETAKVFFICVKDDAISSIVNTLRFPVGSMIVHTAGAVDLAILEPLKSAGHTIGVFYPLMTFTKNVAVDFATVPICVEESNSGILHDIASRISKKVYTLSSIERISLHLGAVFACNFTNHMLALSKEVLEDLPFEILHSLINHTVQKALKAEHPAAVQTGPAIRRDAGTMEKHRELLKDDSDLLTVYNSVSDSIQDWHI